MRNLIKNAFPIGLALFSANSGGKIINVQEVSRRESVFIRNEQFENTQRGRFLLAAMLWALVLLALPSTAFAESALTDDAHLCPSSERDDGNGDSKCGNANFGALPNLSLSPAGETVRQWLGTDGRGAGGVANYGVAQIRVEVPRILGVPGVSKPKHKEPGPEPPKADDSRSTTAKGQTESQPAGSPAAPAAGQDQPAIVKDSVQVNAFTFNVYRGNYDVWSWVPAIEFRVKGPFASGSQLYVEFTQPGAGPWLKFDCKTEETQKDYWWKTECGRRDIPENKGSTYTGPVDFAIKMRNELAGTDVTLFTGKAKVEKVLSNEVGPKAAQKFVYYVNHDWNLPIGYVFLTPDDVSGWKKTTLNVAFWARGEYQGSFQPHLFYQGKEVGKVFLEGREVGKPVCDPEVQHEPSQYIADTVPQKAKWMRVRCRFFGVQGWDRTGEEPGLFGPLHQLDKNPGEYEFKVLWNNKLARSIKFTVGTDGKFDNGIASANKFGSERVIVPVTIIGDQDGAWGKAAWKTEAFYENPLTGFTSSP